MPSLPASRVTFMIEFGTVAGASPPAWPWTLTSKPTACGVDHPLADNLLDLVGQRRALGQVDGFAPKLRACSSRSLFTPPRRWLRA
jgi:hypothetical protein